ncbi:MAG: response regulator [Phycisphaeraceae bacterium]|nr:response regulator [Phycisphaeraceae bacterium]
MPEDHNRVMIVEDEGRLRELLADQLPRMGFEAVPVRTGEHAIKQMEEEACDIVLLDLNLPVMSGLEVLEKIHQRWPQTCVIIMTGFGDLEAAKTAIRYGVVEFLTKPCHLGEIEVALSRAHRELVDPDQPPMLRDQEAEEPSDDPMTVPQTLAEAQRKLIMAAMKRHNGNRTAVAAELGISRRTLYNRLAEYGNQDLMEEG